MSKYNPRNPKDIPIEQDWSSMIGNAEILPESVQPYVFEKIDLEALEENNQSHQNTIIRVVNAMMATIEEFSQLNSKKTSLQDYRDHIQSRLSELTRSQPLFILNDVTKQKIVALRDKINEHPSLFFKHQDLKAKETLLNELNIKIESYEIHGKDALIDTLNILWRRDNYVALIENAKKLIESVTVSEVVDTSVLDEQSIKNNLEQLKHDFEKVTQLQKELRLPDYVEASDFIEQLHQGGVSAEDMVASWQNIYQPSSSNSFKQVAVFSQLPHQQREEYDVLDKEIKTILLNLNKQIETHEYQISEHARKQRHEQMQFEEKKRALLQKIEANWPKIEFGSNESSESMVTIPALNKIDFGIINAELFLEDLQSHKQDLDTQAWQGFFEAQTKKLSEQIGELKQLKETMLDTHLQQQNAALVKKDPTDIRRSFYTTQKHRAPILNHTDLEDHTYYLKVQERLKEKFKEVSDKREIFEEQSARKVSVYDALHEAQSILRQVLRLAAFDYDFSKKEIETLKAAGPFVNDLLELLDFSNKISKATLYVPFQTVPKERLIDLLDASDEMQALINQTYEIAEQANKGIFQRLVSGTKNYGRLLLEKLFGAEDPLQHALSKIQQHITLRFDSLIPETLKICQEKILETKNLITDLEKSKQEIEQTKEKLIEIKERIARIKGVLQPKVQAIMVEKAQAINYQLLLGKRDISLLTQRLDNIKLVALSLESSFSHLKSVTNYKKENEQVWLKSSIVKQWFDDHKKELSILKNWHQSQDTFRTSTTEDIRNRVKAHIQDFKSALVEFGDWQKKHPVALPNDLLEKIAALANEHNLMNEMFQSCDLEFHQFKQISQKLTNFHEKFGANQAPITPSDAKTNAHENSQSVTLNTTATVPLAQKNIIDTDELRQKRANLLVPLINKFFGSKEKALEGQFGNYIQARAKNYRIRDFFGRIFSLGGRLFVPEAQKRENYITQLKEKLENYKNGFYPNHEKYQALIQFIEDGAKQFLPREIPGSADYKKSLQHQLVELKTELEKTYGTLKGYDSKMKIIFEKNEEEDNLRKLEPYLQAWVDGQSELLERYDAFHRNSVKKLEDMKQWVPELNLLNASIRQEKLPSGQNVFDMLPHNFSQVTIEPIARLLQAFKANNHELAKKAMIMPQEIRLRELQPFLQKWVNTQTELLERYDAFPKKSLLVSNKKLKAINQWIPDFDQLNASIRQEKLASGEMAFEMLSQDFSQVTIEPIASLLQAFKSNNDELEKRAMLIEQAHPHQKDVNEVKESQKQSVEESIEESAEESAEELIKSEYELKRQEILYELRGKYLLYDTKNEVKLSNQYKFFNDNGAKIFWGKLVDKYEKCSVFDSAQGKNNQEKYDALLAHINTQLDQSDLSSSSPTEKSRFLVNLRSDFMKARKELMNLEDQLIKQHQSSQNSPDPN